MSQEVKQDGNVVVIGNARFTFISPTLVRLEYADGAKFLDAKTLFAQNREPQPVEVTIENKHQTEGNRRYTLKTSGMRIEFENDGFPFGQTNLNVFFKNHEKGKNNDKNGERHWYMASTQGRNLRGAIVTLDGVGGPVPLQEGLLSRDGWYVINDSNKEIFTEDWIAPRDRNHIQDIYLFTYGDDYKQALKDLQTISGPAPMTRKYVHGSWYCRWWRYTADDYRQLAKEYAEHDFPLDIMVFDMDWHITRGVKSGSGHAGNKGWTGYTWERELIPDPAALIKEFNDDKINVVLNEHPHDGIRDHDSMYPDFMKELGLPADGRNVIFDAGDKAYMDAFLKWAHKESEDMGVAFWWLDWQQDYVQPVVRGTNMAHLPWLNHLYFEASKKNNLRGAGFSRWGGWGDHRHPIQFSGDSGGNWELLKFEIELTSTSGNAGCFFWAHDLGGFYGGDNPELLSRWIQFGLLNSSLRLHSVCDDKLDRRPWLWGKEAEDSMRIMYHLRSQIMPYIYSSVYQCHRDMVPLNRAMYVEYPREEEAYRNPQQFMFGDLLLGAPITQAGEGEAKLATQKVWLPAGTTWYQFFSGQRYEGGQTITESCDLNSFPLFIKAGVPFPMQPYTPRMASDDLTHLIVRAYPGDDGKSAGYTLYEDDGLTQDYEKKGRDGGYATTDMTYAKQNGKVTLTVEPAQGHYPKQVKARTYTFELPALDKAPKNVTINGKAAEAVKDDTLKGYKVSAPETPITERVTLSFEE